MTDDRKQTAQNVSVHPSTVTLLSVDALREPDVEIDEPMMFPATKTRKVWITFKERGKSLGD